VTANVLPSVRSRYRHRTPFYDLVVSTAPARIHSLQVDPSGRGRYLGVVSNFGPKGSAPFASYGSRLKWHEDRCFEAGRPARVVPGPQSLRLEQIPVGPHGLEVTWNFWFADEDFVTELRWSAATVQHGLWEAGWKLDGIARHIGDGGAIDSPPGFRGAYRDREQAWLAWWEDDPRYRHCLVTALLPRSSDRGDACYLEVSQDRPVSWGAWLAVSQPGGISLPAGTEFSAGKWRVGASARPADTAFAAALGTTPGAGTRSGHAAPRPSGAPGRYGSDLHAARDWNIRQAAGPADGRSGAAGVRRGDDGAWLLTDGTVLAALVPVTEGGYRARCYVRHDGDWHLALTGGPGRRYLDASPDDTGTGLLVRAESADPDGTPRSHSTEHWTLRADPPRIHIDSTDALLPGSTMPAPHEYLAYPGGHPKPGTGDGFDTLMGPHLRPMADLVMGQHAMRSPAIGVQQGSAFAALVPDLLVHRQHGAFGIEESPRHFGLFLDLDVADQRADGPILRFGWATMEWTYSLWRVEEGYFCRKLEEPAPRGSVRLAYDLLLDAAAPAQGVIASAQKLLWSSVGHRYFSQSTLPQTQPAGSAFDDAWSWGHQLYEERTVHGTRVGAVRVDREFPPDAMFTTWFNSLRSSYGIAANGRSRGDDTLWRQGHAGLSLLLSAPHDHGAFPTIARFGPEKIEWFGGHKNFANQMPWGPSSYNTFDMSWTAYWVLRWHQDLGPEPAAVGFARQYGEFLLRVQLDSGAVPSWLRMCDLAIDPHLRESAQTAASLLFLAELAMVTGDDRFREAACRAGRYVADEHVSNQRWDDFEVYYSNAPKSEGASDPLAGMSAQDTLSMHLAAAGFLALARATGDRAWLGPGQRALDQLLQYQAVWPATFLSLYTFGGFSVQNTDQEWNDARQAQVAPTLLDYARATGRGDYAERGIAALRASYATMCTPTAEAINPRYFDYQPRGWGNENYAHNPYDAPTTPVPTPHFDWGVGTALAAFAEVRNRFGDVWVDLAHYAAYGIDDVAVTRFSAGDGLLELDLESRTAGHEVLVKADGMRVPSMRLRVNGIEIGPVTPAQLAGGVRVPTRFRGRIVHNPCRVAPLRAGTDLRLTADVSQGTGVMNATVTYRVGDGHWHTEPMTMLPSGQLAGSIPGASITQGAVIEYYLSALTSGGPAQAPEVDPDQVPFRLTVG
jgi:hypothetical protein